MKNMINFTGVAVLALALTQSLQATPLPISGNIVFHGDVTLNSGSVNTATEVVSFINPVTTGAASGTFAPLAGDPAIFTSGSWSFNTSSAINNFWTVGAFSFELLSSSIVYQQNGFLDVSGTGLVSASGYQTTQMDWAFTAQDPNSGGSSPQWSFSASDSTPDGGATVMLLGIALSGVALLKKKLTA